MDNREFVQALRNLADFYEGRPELNAPDSMGFSDNIQLTYYGHCGSFRADTRDGLKQFARIVGGRVEKKADGDSFEMIARRDGFEIRTYTSDREKVCRRIQVGTKVEPEHIIPAQPEQVVPEKEVPVYEWDCSPILEAEDEPVSA